MPHRSERCSLGIREKHFAVFPQAGTILKNRFEVAERESGANGQATANKSLAASLSDQILQYQYIQKLTDKIQVMLLPSGNQTIFDLKSLLGQNSGQSGQ